MDKTSTKYIIDIDYKEIGGRIQLRRKKMGISQKELAESIGITASYLSNIERGVSAASLDLIIILSLKLKVTPDFFILGVLRSSNISANIIEGLKMCSDRDLKVVSDIVMSLLRHSDGKEI